MSLNNFSLSMQKIYNIVFGNITIGGNISIRINDKSIDGVFVSQFCGFYID